MSKKYKLYKDEIKITFIDLITQLSNDIKKVKTVGEMFNYTNSYSYKKTVYYTYKYLSMVKKRKKTVKLIFDLFKFYIGYFGYTHTHKGITIANNWKMYPLQKKFFDDVMIFLIQQHTIKISI